MFTVNFDAPLDAVPPAFVTLRGTYRDRGLRRDYVTVDARDIERTTSAGDRNALGARCGSRASETPHRPAPGDALRPPHGGVECVRESVPRRSDRTAAALPPVVPEVAGSGPVAPVRTRSALCPFCHHRPRRKGLVKVWSHWEVALKSFWRRFRAPGTGFIGWRYGCCETSRRNSQRRPTRRAGRSSRRASSWTVERGIPRSSATSEVDRTSARVIGRGSTDIRWLRGRCERSGPSIGQGGCSLRTRAQLLERVFFWTTRPSYGAAGTTSRGPSPSGSSSSSTTGDIARCTRSKAAANSSSGSRKSMRGVR